MALAQAGEAARGATVYVTLEPCAHESPRGPACADLLIAAGVARVVIALRRSRSAHRRRRAWRGCAPPESTVVEGVRPSGGARGDGGLPHAPARTGRPHVTLKLATSLDGRIALAVGREPLDHRAGGARPRPSRARAA